VPPRPRCAPAALQAATARWLPPPRPPAAPRARRAPTPPNQRPKPVLRAPRAPTRPPQGRLRVWTVTRGPTRTWPPPAHPRCAPLALRGTTTRSLAVPPCRASAATLGRSRPRAQPPAPRVPPVRTPPWSSHQRAWLAPQAHTAQWWARRLQKPALRAPRAPLRQAAARRAHRAPTACGAPPWRAS